MLEEKPALTEYWVLERLDDWTLIRVRLHTGRTHQIRVHFSSLGHPLAGDSLYGGKTVQIPGLTRQFLHAQKIEVQLPDNTWIEADSELPQDLKDVLKNLGSKKVNNL
jgi:23S rRNA pseudouridine1911/1915/1917 synthase